MTKQTISEYKQAIRKGRRKKFADCPMKGRMCQCSDTAKCIHQPIEELQPYADRNREDWIKWAESEIYEYQKFLKFLKKKN